jgi:DNA polymerase-1
LKKLVVLDSHALIHRSFYAVRELNLKDGTPINAVYGFAKVLLQIIEKLDPDYFAVVKDMPGKTFRHEKFAEYKGTRSKAPDELYAQIPLVYELVESFGIPVLGKESFEADDIAGTIAKSKDIPDDIHRYLITGDFDYLQLVDDKTTVIHFKKGFTETKEFSKEKVREYYALDINQILDYKAIVGDSSDNLPGVRGVGPKGATKLLHKYNSLDAIYNHLDEITGKVHELLETYKESAYLTKDLARIKCDVDIELNIDDMKFELAENILDIESTFHRFEFNFLLSKLSRMAKKFVNNGVEELFEEKTGPSQDSLF